MSDAPQIFNYTLGARIGGGGFADVYRARHDVTRRDVAIKVLRDAPTDAAARRRFDSEIQAMAILDQHRNIARILDVVHTLDARPGIVMDFYRAGSLADQLRQEGPLKAREVLAIGVQLCAALQSAHLYGVWHRDVKPANILRGADGEPVLSDFGISTVAAAGVAKPAGWSAAFVPPEVLLATAGGPRVDETQWDVYSLCATLYALLDGQSPYETPDGPNDNRTVAERVRTGRPRPLRVAMAPPALLTLLDLGVSRDVADRPTSAEDLFLRLREIEQQLPGVPLTEYRPFRVEPPDAAAPDPAAPPLGPDSDGSVLAWSGSWDGPAQPVLAPPTPGLPAGPPAPRRPIELGAPDPTRRSTGSVTQLSTDGYSAGAQPSQAAPPVVDADEADATPVTVEPWRKRLLTAVIAILVVGVVGWGVSSALAARTPSGAGHPSTAVAPGLTTGSPTPQVIVEDLPVAAISTRRNGASVEFSWTYPSPRAGDRFYVVRTDVVDPAPVWRTDPNITIDATHACIEVTIYRADGRGGQARRACYP